MPKEQLETKEARLARQLKQHKQMVKDLKESVAKSYHMKVQRDAFYINFSNIVEECI